tara:strand:- start:3227 stop:3565 length:339 start_codon:yes stop_codon:yes gene_type:complete
MLSIKQSFSGFVVVWTKMQQNWRTVRRRTGKIIKIFPQTGFSDPTILQGTMSFFVLADTALAQPDQILPEVLIHGLTKEGGTRFPEITGCVPWRSGISFGSGTKGPLPFPPG